MEGAKACSSGSFNVITVILLGKNGYNKALIGNSILGNECFSPEASSCYRRVQCMGNMMCCVINTPDLHVGPQPGSEEGLKELKPCYPDPRVFLLIMQDDLVSSEETAMFARLKESYGETVVDKTIIVLVSSEEKRTKPDQNLQRIIYECGGKVCTFKHGMTGEELYAQLVRACERMQEDFTEETERIYENIDIPEDPFSEKPDKENAQPTPAEQHLVPDIPERKEKLQSENAPVVPDGRRKVMTIVLLGQTGSGKSATGNTILARRHFESRASSTAVTQECERAEGLVFGIKVRVIDTPDFFNEDLKDPGVHIQKCKELSQQEPVVYLLVMHMGRFTEGEREIVSRIQKTFGEEVVKKIVVLFTGKEKLKGKSLDDYLTNTDPCLQQLIRDTGSRCHAFNNNDKSRHQVKELVKIIVEMLSSDFQEYRYKKVEHKTCRVL